MLVCSFSVLVDLFSSQATKSVKNTWNDVVCFAIIETVNDFKRNNKMLPCAVLQLLRSRTENQLESVVRLRIPVLRLISYPTLDSLIILLVTTSSFIYIDHKMHEEIR